MLRLKNGEKERFDRRVSSQNKTGRKILVLPPCLTLFRWHPKASFLTAARFRGYVLCRFRNLNRTTLRATSYQASPMILTKLPYESWADEVMGSMYHTGQDCERGFIPHLQLHSQHVLCRASDHFDRAIIPGHELQKSAIETPVDHVECEFPSRRLRKD